MSVASTAAVTEESRRRIAEYRRLGFERQAPAHVVYHDEHVACPWAGCAYRIAGINFQLDQQGAPDAVAHWLAAWWTGAGLVGRCPGCDNWVLFSLDAKRAVRDPSSWGTAVLPEDWQGKAHLVERPV